MRKKGRFDPEDFHRISRDIFSALSTSSDIADPKRLEVGWIRTAIGGAYYAAFLYIRELTSYRRYGRKDVHQKVIDLLNSYGGDYYNIGNRLSKLRKERNDADYDLAKRFTLSSLERALANVDYIFMKAGKLRWPPHR